MCVLLPRFQLQNATITGKEAEHLNVFCLPQCGHVCLRASVCLCVSVRVRVGGPFAQNASKKTALPKFSRGRSVLVVSVCVCVCLCACVCVWWRVLGANVLRVALPFGVLLPHSWQ